MRDILAVIGGLVLALWIVLAVWGLVAGIREARRIKRAEEELRALWEAALRVHARELLDKLPPPESDAEAVERLIASTRRPR